MLVLGESNYGMPITRGLYVHLDAADPRSYPGKGALWHDLSGNHDAELPGDSSNPLADPFWTGRSFRFKGYSFARLLGSQSGWFKTLTKKGARFTIDCYFRTSTGIRNPHFLLADGAHGNPVEGCGFSFYFFNFENTCLRLSIQNNARTPLTRATHCTHSQTIAPETQYRAAISVDEPRAFGMCALDDYYDGFDANYVEPTDRDSPYYVNIGAPGNIEYNVEAHWQTHVSQLEFSKATWDDMQQIPYGRMRFHPGFELHAMLIYDRALSQNELQHNYHYLTKRFGKPEE